MLKAELVTEEGETEVVTGGKRSAQRRKNMDGNEDEQAEKKNQSPFPHITLNQSPNPEKVSPIECLCFIYPVESINTFKFLTELINLSSILLVPVGFYRSNIL